MAKFTKKVAEQILMFIEQGNYTIGQICGMFDISRKTFYEWKENKPGFGEQVDDAMEFRRETLVGMAQNALKERLTNRKVEAVKIISVPVVNRPGEYKEIRKEIKYIEYEPDLKAIKYVLEREDKRLAQERERKEKELSAENQPWTIVVQDKETKYQLEYLQETMGDGTHPSLTGIPRAENWRDKYIEREGHLTPRPVQRERESHAASGVD